MASHAPELAPRSRSTQLCLPRSAVRLLAACARSDQLCPELTLADAHAARFFAELGGDATSFGAGELRCAAFRASLVDQLAESFFERKPGGVGVALWPMLGTRAHRLRSRTWLELDAPELAALRKRYLPARAGWSQQVSCLCGAGKAARDFAAPGPRLFVLDEAVLPLHAEAMMRVLDSLCGHAASGAELILAHDGAAPVCAAPDRALELELGNDLVRYPRLRAVDPASYPEDLHSSLLGLNAVARLQGHDAPALVHLVVR